MFFSFQLFSQKKVAVFDPSGLEDNTIIEIAREILIDKIVNSNTYVVLEREKINQVLKENTYQQQGGVDDGQVSSLGKQMGADYVCVSTIKQLSGRYFVSARLVDVETAQAYISATAIDEDVLTAIEIAAKKLTPKAEKIVTTVVEETKKTTTTVEELPKSKKEKFRDKMSREERKAEKEAEEANKIAKKEAEETKKIEEIEIDNSSQTANASTVSIITGGKAIKEDMVSIATNCKQSLAKKFNVINDFPESFTVKGSLKKWVSDYKVNYVIKLGTSGKKVVVNIFNTKKGKYEYIYTSQKINQGQVNLDAIVSRIVNYISNN